jgi:hypothetical protein
MVIWLLALAVISGIFYRMGGSDTYDPKWRDWGCSLVSLATLSLWTHSRAILWVFPLIFLLSWGALSTYHKWLNPFFKKPKTDCYWFNWLAHGLGIGLACLPLYAIGVVTQLVVFRAVLLGILIMIWSERNEQVVWEEIGRGAFIVLTLLILR